MRQHGSPAQLYLKTFLESSIRNIRYEIYSWKQIIRDQGTWMPSELKKSFNNGKLLQLRLNADDFKKKVNLRHYMYH